MSTTPHSGSDREIQQELERAKSEASHLASSTMDTAKQRGHEAIDRAKEQAADRAEELASALETTAEDLETSESGDMLSGYGRSMAELMRRFAGGLREHEIEEFAGQLATFARRNPASFLAGSVALGFGVSRFLKATSTRPLEEYGYADDDDEYLLDEEDDFDFDEPGTVASSDTGFGSSSSFEQGASPGSDYGRPSSGEYGTSGTSSSSSYGTSSTDTRPGYSGTESWPEDRGRERPGAGSSTDHWTPSISDESLGAASSPGQSPGQSASSTGTASPEGGRSNEPRSEEIRRNEP